MCLTHLLYPFLHNIECKCTIIKHYNSQYRRYFVIIWLCYVFYLWDTIIFLETLYRRGPSWHPLTDFICHHFLLSHSVCSTGICGREDWCLTVCVTCSEYHWFLLSIGGVQLAVGLVSKSWIFKRRKIWLINPLYPLRGKY